MKWCFSMRGVVISLFVLLIGVSFFYREQDYEQIADTITANTAKKLQEKNNLVLVGTGGKMMDDIQAMDMSFHYYNEITLTGARKLLVDVVEEYLSDINSNKEIRQYLHNYPFTVKNVEIVIFFYTPDRYKVTPGTINIAAVDEGEVTYYIDYPDKYTIKPILQESYEEAVQAISNKSI